MLAMHARQLRALPARIVRRRAIIARVKALTAHVPEIVPLNEDMHGRANGAYFAVCVPDPVASARVLRRAGIDANPEVFQDCGDERYFKGLAHCCQRARHAAMHVLRLPSYASMSDEDTEHLAHALAASVR
jgi:dTDP-4-amino-4,6-dideoxygalactose transaminase